MYYCLHYLAGSSRICSAESPQGATVVLTLITLRRNFINYSLWINCYYYLQRLLDRLQALLALEIITMLGIASVLAECTPTSLVLNTMAQVTSKSHNLCQMKI